MSIDDLAMTPRKVDRIDVLLACEVLLLAGHTVEAVAVINRVVHGDENFFKKLMPQVTARRGR